MANHCSEKRRHASAERGDRLLTSHSWSLDLLDFVELPSLFQRNAYF